MIQRSASADKKFGSVSWHPSVDESLKCSGRKFVLDGVPRCLEWRSYGGWVDGPGKFCPEALFPIPSYLQ